MLMTYTIKKRDDEYQVRLRIDGKIVATYFTNDGDDANDTLCDMMLRRLGASNDLITACLRACKGKDAKFGYADLQLYCRVTADLDESLANVDIDEQVGFIADQTDNLKTY